MRTSSIAFGITMTALAVVITLRATRSPGSDGGGGDGETGWPLGPPDLVVGLEEPLTFGPHDRDAFRNLVVATGLTGRRYVRAVDIRPGDPGVVHHAVIKLDGTGDSRRRAEGDPGPGFAGMDMGLSTPPEGHFLVWTPGMEPHPGDDGSAWPLDPGTDLVLQLHLPARESAVVLSPTIGLYFSESPPTEILGQIFLNSTRIDIAPGDSAYVVEDEFTVPVDVALRSAFPHAHYLARTVHVTAALPDGSVDSLLTIDDWHFGRQLEYRFPQTRSIPAGSRIRMRFRYDNSADNPNNPSRPPQRVRLGMESTDEMASLRLQVRLTSELDRLRLAEAQARHAMVESPDHPELNYELGTSLLNQGRVEEALPYLLRATAQWPTYPWAWNNLGVAQAQSGDLEAAMESWDRVLALDPDHIEVYNNLGNAALEMDDPTTAVRHFRQAVARSPGSGTMRRNLAIALIRSGDLAGGIGALEEAIRLKPDQSSWRQELSSLREQASAP
jgi:Tfp pilus assembly protein PilF